MDLIITTIVTAAVTALITTIVTMKVQDVRDYIRRPILKVSIESLNDISEIGRILRIRNVGKTCMDGLSVRVDIGVEGYHFRSIVT